MMRILKNNKPWLIVINAPYRLVRDRIGLIKKLDVGVEIYFDNSVIDEVDESHVKETARILRSEGIECTVHAPFMDLSPGGVDKAVRNITKEKLKRAVTMANLLGAAGINCHPGYDRWRFGENIDLWMQGSIETWNEVLAEAGDRLPVMLENIFEEEPDTIYELLRHFDKKNMNFCFDSGHFNLFSKVSLEKWMLSLGNKMKEMHIHDNYGSRDDHLPIGRGTFPFRELKGFLNAHKGDLILTVEVHNEANAVEGTKKIKEYVA